MATDWQSRRDGFDHRRDKPLDRPINWKYWGSLPELKQWDACALSVNVNPENLKTRRMVMPGMPVFLPESFPNRAVELEFQRRLTMFGRVIGGRPLAPVSPAQFAAWCLDVGLENLPPELVAMATPEPRPAPVDWEPYRFREQFTLFELACLAYRKEPASVFNDSWLAIRKHGGIASEVLNNPEAAAAMFYGNPTMYFSPPVGEALERMKKATGLQRSGTLSIEKARSLASVLGLTFPPELSAAPRQQAPEPQAEAPAVGPSGGDAAPLPDPERRLARLREMGGSATSKRGEWKFTRITALVAAERSEGRKRSDEKTIRADLKEAAEAEAEAKRAGHWDGLRG